MANSIIKENRRARSDKNCARGGAVMFGSFLKSIKKDKEKSERLETNLQQYSEFDSQNSDGSRKTTNEPNTRQSVHQNDEPPYLIMRRSRHSGFQKNSSEYCMNAGHNMKSHKTSNNFNDNCSNSRQFNSSKKTYCYENNKKSYSEDGFRKNLPKYSSTSDHHFEFQNNNFEPYNCGTEVKNNKEETFFDNDMLNFKSQFEDDDTEIKYERFCSELDEPIKDSEKKNIKITFKSCNSDSTPNTSLISSSSLTSSVSHEPNSSVLSVSTFSFSNTVSSSVSSPSLILNDISSVLQSNVDLPANTVLSNEFENPSVSDNNIISSSNDNSSYYIPPPVSCTSSISENFCFSTGTNGNIFQNNGPDFSEVSSYADEVDLSLLDSEHFEAISKFILKVVKERSVSFETADKVVYDLNRLFKNHFEGNVIDYYGSYSNDLAITTSDINLMIQTEFSIRKSFMLEVYNILSKELERYHVHQCEEGSTAHKTKINFTHPDTGINCELAYLGRNRNNILKMGKFLKQMCQKNQHVRSLIITAKVWAEHFNINEVEDGKLHPIGFALLIIHFLQHCENPILPVYSCEEEIMEKLPQNDSSVGTLWLGFLKYYTFTFNWQEDVLTVTSRNKVSKKSKKWETYWIAIEDPVTGKNIAESVTNKDVADYIISCFKETYNYFLNGPRILPSSDNEDNQSGAESDSFQLEFSFNDCIVEQSENICQECDDIDDVCEDCKKKIYVQPMASVPKMTDEFLEIVEKALSTVYNKYMLSEKEVDERKCFVKKLESEVRKIYPGAQMRLFGSSANGFGFKNSDLDICLTLENNVKKPYAVLRDLRTLLRKDKNFVNVIAIFSATIPILKFRYKLQGWRGDISLDNVLAVHNSELLHTYSLLDDRCKILGCALKLIAKKALIAEVTEKALSSYSYLIMVIHFLQQTDPPVLPILQDNQFRENFDLDDIVENCNVWFCRNMSYIKERFKTENDTPVAQLFLELLDYYCSFDSTQFITIKQKEILPVSERVPTARLFNIQDPFLVTKNLGRVVSTTKAQETKNVLNKARLLFRTPKKEVPTDLESYFFSTMNLTGRFQKEALCDFCGKFGHDQRDCRQFLSPFQKNNFSFKHYPRNKQYTNQNGFFKRKQINK